MDFPNLFQMKKSLILIIGLLGPMLCSSQEADGVAFQTFDNLQQVFSKAKKENKSVFIDGYATWCTPCKKMDADVYSRSTIGQVLNNDYVSVKVQFDKQDKDSDQIKRWYKDVAHLEKTYHIYGFPTFLFLTADGDLIFKETGYKDLTQFAGILKKLKDPMQNFALQVSKFKSGKLTNGELLPLALKAKEFQDTLALTIARGYKLAILEQQNSVEYFNSEVRDYMVQFQNLFTLKDKSVRYLLTSSSKADRLLDQKGFSNKFTDYLITRDIINPIVKSNAKNAIAMPNWIELKKMIETDYGTKVSNRVLIAAKSEWYSKNANWPNAIKYKIKEMDINGIDTAGWAASNVNRIVYSLIFMHSDNPFYLKKGIMYMKKLLKAHPNYHTWIDTYANLLYKLGDRRDAIIQETRALNIATDLKDKDSIAEYEQIILKMKSDLPTW